MGNLILSLFPGVGLLDQAFEKEGFCVVRGPDLLWGGDIRAFNPPAGVFDGVIGGPPCPAHSRMATLVRASGKQTAPDMVPEFTRCIEAARPAWWLMENGTYVPTLRIDGYLVDRREFDNRWLGQEQARRRTFQFGTREGHSLNIEPAVFDHPNEETTCLASEGSAGRISRVSTGDGQKAQYKPRRDWARFCELQGLPGDYLADAPLTVEGKYRVVGNGVPLPLGRAVARAVKDALAHRKQAA